MKVELEIVLIEQKIYRKNYLVYLDNTIYRIVDFSQDSSVVQVKNVFTGVVSHKPQTELEGKFVKFIVKHDRVLLSVRHGDYGKCIDTIILTSRDKQIGVSKIISSMLGIEGDISIVINGTVDKVPCKTSKGDTIEITDLKLIDKYNLYSLSDRIYKVVNIIGKGSSVKFSINIGTIPVIINRTSFKLVGKVDYKQLFVY